MTEISENHLCDLPTELLINIFEFLPAKELMKCRKVCMRWKEIIDPRAEKDNLWMQFTKWEFASIYRIVIKNTYKCKQWYDIYRSLSLWPKLNLATDSSDEFAPAGRVHDEIRDFSILSNGIIGVHKKMSITYYNIDTLQMCKKDPMQGDFSRYVETDDTIIILGSHFHLHIIRKGARNPNEESNITFYNTKIFLVVENKVFFINFNNEVFLCDLDEELNGKLLKKSDDGIMTLSYCDGFLYLLSFRRTIYKLVDGELITICLLDNVSNFLDYLRRYNFLEHVDWRVYFEWMAILYRNIPDGPLRNILTIYPYGDVYFIGSNYGVLRIYISPYTAGELDLFSTAPIKQYNFMERRDCPVLSLCPILRIEVIEMIDGHKVVVAMPKKIAVLTFVHNFDKEVSFTVSNDPQNSLSN